MYGILSVLEHGMIYTKTSLFGCSRRRTTQLKSICIYMGHCMEPVTLQMAYLLTWRPQWGPMSIRIGRGDDNMSKTISFWIFQVAFLMASTIKGDLYYHRLSVCQGWWRRRHPVWYWDFMDKGPEMEKETCWPISVRSTSFS